MRNICTIAALCALASAGAFAQTRVAEPKEPSATDRCRKDVKDYVEALKYVRAAAGPQIGEKVAGGYLSEAEVDRVVATQGHCAASKMRRERGTPR